MECSYEEKLTEYVYKYTDMIAKICCLNLNNLSDSDDVVQEIFIKYLKRKPVFKDEQHEKAWFIRVTINLCRDYNKSFWNKNMNINEENMLELEAKSENLELVKEVRQLPEKYANAIYLYYYEGYQVKEIARLLGKKENTVLSLLNRGRKLLKDRMEE